MLGSVESIGCFNSANSTPPLRERQTLDVGNGGRVSHVLQPAENYSRFGSAEHEFSAYSAEAESITLLKNKNLTLPIANRSLIIVVGPKGDSMSVLE
jgi:beta-glucosidase-like glycosyl hydrolase